MASDAFSFSGDDAMNYETYLGPLLFEPASLAFVSKLDRSDPGPVLELACGTGRLTKHLRNIFPSSVELLATDISADMIHVAEERVNGPDLAFRTADMQELPFDDNRFSLVLCQFGLMFLPDKAIAFREIFRVLKPGGRFMFTTWDSPKNIPLINLIIEEMIIPFFNDEEPARFRTPFSLYEPDGLFKLLNDSGFERADISHLTFDSGKSTPEQVTNAFLLKHPLGRVVASKDAAALPDLAGEMEKRIGQQFGKDKINASLSALLGSGFK